MDRAFCRDMNWPCMAIWLAFAMAARLLLQIHASHAVSNWWYVALECGLFLHYQPVAIISCCPPHCLYSTMERSDFWSLHLLIPSTVPIACRQTRRECHQSSFPESSGWPRVLVRSFHLYIMCIAVSNCLVLFYIPSTIRIISSQVIGNKMIDLLICNTWKTD